VSLAANASDSDGTVSKVEFYNGATLLGTDTTSPYTYTWNSVGAGSYTLTAKAYDDGGLVTTSSPGVGITVTGESVTTPTQPTGTTYGTTGVSYTYTTGGSTSSLGHTVQYQFDWGDGTAYSTWSTGTSASHSWGAAGTYSVRAEARCQTDGVVTAWSTALSAVISSASSGPSSTLAVTSGQLVIAPTRLDLAHPDSAVKFHLHGSSGGSVEIRVFDAAGEYVGRQVVSLDAGGVGTGSLTISGVGGRALTAGAYWAVASGGGVNDKKLFYVARKK
jgi:hypothetical protein